MKNITPHKDINAIAALFTSGLRDIFGEGLTGFYLTGSLTYGGFERGSSDLDFVAIIKKTFSDTQRKKVKSMHAEVDRLYPEWRGRIEISYVIESMLSSVKPPRMRRPYFNGGLLWNPDPRYGNEWLVNLYALRKCGKPLIGPEPSSVIKPIDMKDVREASKKDLYADWKPRLASKEPFGDGQYWTTSHIQAFTVLTMCRALYRFKKDGVVSKRAASAWAKHSYPQWKSLIEKAEDWKMGQPMDVGDETLAFIRFTLSIAG